MFAKWWDDRLHDMEVAAEHGDSRSLHQGVKQHLDLIANDGTSKKALSSNHQEDHESMTKHFHVMASCCGICQIREEPFG